MRLFCETALNRRLQTNGTLSGPLFNRCITTLYRLFVCLETGVMANRSLWSLCLLLALLLPLEVLSQDLDLTVALDNDDDPTPPPKPAKPAEPAGGTGGGFNLEDAVDVVGTTTTTTTKAPPKVVPKAPTGTKAPVKPKPKPGGFTDNELLDVSKDNTYKPDKGKGGRPSGDDQINQYDDNNETTAEVGTIAGIASAVAMALVGAITSYISYQKKKLCFSIQQSLNTDMVKAENPEAVVATEPQVQQTLLEPPNAEPPTEENAV
ncbi:CD99 antigen-like protein 2 isoform X2 [Perca flavescens]|uniref:CD99 antigen-like protein 2 isoform X2 n=1 Tax=Perca flavescens TaxID=8167 RepID=UPI00106E1FC1|nr:CD99 antigen-like protein 2 isoform X2 [Perca flavescens]